MTFLSEDFLLNNRFSKELYHEWAINMPIIDYHCHLSPEEIAQDNIFENITQIWISGDHYKWRAMRALGIPEKYITGTASDEQKFEKWLKAIPYTMRNPLYHWSHLELKRYFGVNELINGENSAGIYRQLSEKVNSAEFSTQNILKKMNVKVVCTTDDPTDDLKYHVQINKNKGATEVFPSFRPDNILKIDSPGYIDYLMKFGESADSNIESLHDLLEAIEKRIIYFNERGCRVSDHGLSYIHNGNFNEKDAENAFLKCLQNGRLSDGEIENFKGFILFSLCRLYHKYGWVQQFHLGALRDTNSRKLKELGPDTGFDSIGDFSQARNMMQLFDKLEGEKALTKTIIYNLNPSFNEVFATMAGNYNDGEIRGKMQFGSAWWYLDQKDGMEKQLNTLSNLGILSTFIGMLTDSRSFLSYPRHEYFRRILCNLFGEDIRNGELPNDIPWIGKIIQDICYNNAGKYFGWGELD